VISVSTLSLCCPVIEEFSPLRVKFFGIWIGEARKEALERKLTRCGAVRQDPTPLKRKVINDRDKNNLQQVR
jgi:hypothetical protein